MIDPIRLNAYVDEELNDQDRSQLEAELRLCQLSQAETDAIRTIKTIISSRSETHTCTETWTVCIERLNGIDKARRTENFVTKYAWALCAGVFVTILVGGAINRSSSLNSAELPNMMSQLTPSGRQDSALADRTQLYDEVLKRASKQLDRLRLLSVRTGDFDGQHVEKYDLEDAAGVFALFVVAGNVDTEGFIAMPQAGYISGLMGQSNCVAWHNQGRTLMIVGDRSYDNLVKAAMNHAVPPSN